MKIVIDKSGKKFFCDAEKDLHTHKGIITKTQLDNAKPGDVLKTHLGEEMVLLDADFMDMFENIERGPAIILPKDAGIISAYTGISSGSNVLEAGSGSGAFTCYLANLIKPDGKVYSYEKRQEFLEIAKRNVERMGLSQFVEFRNKCTHDGIDEKNIDVIILDMPDPQNSIAHAEAALKPGGYLMCYLPHTEQVSTLLEACKKTRLRLVKVSDVIENEANEKLNFKAKIKHTAYLVFLRKI